MGDKIRRFIPPVTWVFIGLVFGTICFGIGLYVKNWYHVEYDSELKIIDIVNLIITVLLAGFLPFIISKTIESKNKIGEIAKAEIDRYRAHVDSTHEKFNEVYKAQSISPADKIELILRGDFFDDNFDLLDTAIRKAFNNKANIQLQALSTAQIRYWQTITDEDIINSSANKISQRHQLYERKYFVEINQALIDLTMLIQK